ncbi:Uncharacterised protein [Mycobacteroides abscessus subsp. abscessus]|uniref:hypothetical protein n=2 Tax=Mycobacteroides abscessus TaxID=36809 RepID=UPI000926828E|nr:hypothetical protein [Mycobacteroides abscessus]SHR80720.1 Uncharacterised protein [Mycobacteroides abscessus subsp. abscessus]
MFDVPKLTASSDRYLKQVDDIKRFVTQKAHENPATEIAHILHTKREPMGIIPTMVDRAIESNRKYFMSAPEGEPPVGHYLNMRRLPSDFLDLLVRGKTTYEKLADTCARDGLDELHQDVRTATGFAVLAGYPQHRWVIQGYRDYQRIYDMMFRETVARIAGAGNNFDGPGCDWPLSPACKGMLATHINVIPFACPWDKVVFFKVCSMCWRDYVDSYQISASLGTGLTPG